MYLLMNKDRGGSSGARNAGLEPYCEILGAELAGKLLSEAVSYALINMHGEPASKCRLLRASNMDMSLLPVLKSTTALQMI